MYSGYIDMQTYIDIIWSLKRITTNKIEILRLILIINGIKKYFMADLLIDKIKQLDFIWNVDNIVTVLVSIIYCELIVNVTIFVCFDQNKNFRFKI
jgi:hypothetical protein